MRVFIADDSNIIIAKLLNLLRQYEDVEIIGYSGNYEDAVKKIAQNEIDLALLDIRLPGGSGMDLINFIKYSHPATKIAMLTNYSFPQFRRRCKDLGADYFFDKTNELDFAIKLITGNRLEKNGFEGV